jgi:hypothetical protein
LGCLHTLSDYATGAPFGGVSQEIDTIVGQMYEVSFDLGRSYRWDRPSAIEVSAAENSQIFTSNTTGGLSDWDNFSMLFIANLRRYRLRAPQVISILV